MKMSVQIERMGKGYVAHAELDYPFLPEELTENKEALASQIYAAMEQSMQRRLKPNLKTQLEKLK